MPRSKIENHKTAEIILESAQRHFLQKGFEGTSINDIANGAKINKSLIYHHFSNKENLWKAVKERILERAAEDSLGTIGFKHPTLKEFLKSFIAFRFHLYAHHPELVRLVSWQRLEFQGQSLTGVANKNFSGFDEHILSLQKAGEIRTDLKPEVITYLIMSLSSNGFIDKVSFLESQEGQAQYLSLIIESLYTILSPKC